MIGARIQCDNCKFIGEMEMTANCKTTAVTPSGWAVVYPTIRIKGERELSREERTKLKAKIQEKTPPFHICPKCLFGTWEVNVSRLLGVVQS